MCSSNISNLSTHVLVHPILYRRGKDMFISVDNSLSMHDKIICPPQLRALILEDLHSGHMGIDHKALEFIYNRDNSLSKTSSAMVQRLKKKQFGRKLNVSPTQIQSWGEVCSHLWYQQKVVRLGRQVPLWFWQWDNIGEEGRQIKNRPSFSQSPPTEKHVTSTICLYHAVWKWSTIPCGDQNSPP